MKKQINLNVKAYLFRGAFYLLLLLAFCAIPFALAQRTTAKGNRPANVITVTNSNDSGPGSLRQALADAQDGDTINFDPSVASVMLTTAELAIDKSITLSGAPQMVTVERSVLQTEFRIFHVMPSHSVEINDLTISSGHITGDNGGGILNDNSTLTIAHCTVSGNAIVSGSGNNFGGGIHNSGTMTLNQVIVNNNNASWGGDPNGLPSGGGISNTGTMMIIDGTVQSNGGMKYWLWYGGGIYNSNTGMMTITGSTISNNQTGNTGHFGAYGGGIFNDGTMTIQDSTISGNTALGGNLQGGEGGGICGNNTTISNSTITGNSALRGGGVAGGGNIAHTTFSNNSGGNGGALYLTSPLELGTTILKAGASGVNIFNNGGSLITHGYNVCSDNGSGFLNGPGDQINTDPMLGPLQDNGGPTFTHALLPGSPAMDAGDPNFTPPPYYDQRGPTYWRVRNGRVDVGSFEVQAGATPTPTPTPTASPTPTFTPTATATATTTATATATFTPTPTPTATPSPTVVLYDQYSYIGNGATLSANFTDFPSYNSDLADDFVVPEGQAWNVQSIDADGVYFNCPNSNCIGATDWNVFFYTDNAGFPGTQIYSATHQPVHIGNAFTVNLPVPAVLTPGRYWVEIQPNMTFSTQGEWAWTDRTVTSNNPAAWQNPGGGLGMCPSWSRRGATCNIDPSAPDQVYRLNGTLGTPTPTPTPTATATVTPTSTPTPTHRPNMTPRPRPTPPSRR